MPFRIKRNLAWPGEIGRQWVLPLQLVGQLLAHPQLALLAIAVGML